MRLSSLSPIQLSGAQIALAAVLAVGGMLLLLPRPRGRFVPGGIALLIASFSGFSVWLYSTFGKPMPDVVGTALFVLFSTGALGFGTVLVVQRNPARGAIAFAFVILSTCGLFLLLVAPFLMAATIIIYAGAIIVTFLFVLMLSQVEGPSDENDRSREPLFGALAGFAFAGLVLFTVYLSSGVDAAKVEAAEGAPQPRQKLPAPVVTGEERANLLAAAEELGAAADRLTALDERLGRINEQIARHPAADQAGREALRESQHAMIEDWVAYFGGSARRAANAAEAVGFRQSIAVGGRNAELRGDRQAQAARGRAAEIAFLAGAIPKRVSEEDFLNTRRIPDARVADVRRLRDEALLLAGAGELPARNVANVGYLLYADHLLAVELAGTLLLVATIGAVAIAQRRGAPV
jgi:NADH-quinone oxidoreductase subunit J